MLNELKLIKWLGAFLRNLKIMTGFPGKILDLTTISIPQTSSFPLHSLLHNHFMQDLWFSRLNHRLSDVISFICSKQDPLIFTRIIYSLVLINYSCGFGHLLNSVQSSWERRRCTLIFWLPYWPFINSGYPAGCLQILASWVGLILVGSLSNSSQCSCPPEVVWPPPLEWWLDPGITF